jgi:hypothetical protein
MVAPPEVGRGAEEVRLGVKDGRAIVWVGNTGVSLPNVAVAWITGRVTLRVADGSAT